MIDGRDVRRACGKGTVGLRDLEWLQGKALASIAVSCLHTGRMKSKTSLHQVEIMAALTVRGLPEEVHRALRMRAARNGRSTEAEVRAILEEAVKPRERLKLGSWLADIGRQVRLTDEEVDLITRRPPSAPRSLSFE